MHPKRLVLYGDWTFTPVHNIGHRTCVTAASIPCPLVLRYVRILLSVNRGEAKVTLIPSLTDPSGSHLLKSDCLVGPLFGGLSEPNPRSNAP